MTPNALLTNHLPLRGGQICIRALAHSSALVGVVQLPQQFVPIEGQAHLLIEDAGVLNVVPHALDQGVPKGMESYGVNDLMRQAIWRVTAVPSPRVVRFIQAFPESNHWVVFGPSAHSLGANAPSHQWFRLGEAGQIQPIEAPGEARGLTLGQILTTLPVWPNAVGVLHSVPEINTVWRGHQHRYRQLLAQSTRDPELDRTLEATLQKDPELSQLHVGRVDRDYCAYLAALEDRGELQPDRPRSVAELAHRQEQARRLVSGQAHDHLQSPVSDVPAEPVAVEVLPSVIQRLRRRTP